jgi:hypothetical protein
MKTILLFLATLLIATVAKADACVLIALNASQRQVYSQYGQVPDFRAGCLVVQEDTQVVYEWTGVNYIAINSAGGTVASVNGQTGVVVLNASNVSAANINLSNVTGVSSVNLGNAFYNNAYVSSFWGGPNAAFLGNSLLIPGGINGMIYGTSDVNSGAASQTSADVGLQSGDNNNGTNPTAPTGDMFITTGNQNIAGSSGLTGALFIATGFTAGSNSSGLLNINSGSTVSSPSGMVNLLSGDSSGSSSGGVLVSSGQSFNATSGYAVLESGNSDGTGSTGDVTMSSGFPSGSGNSGNILIRSGSTNAGNSGDLDLSVGTAGGTRGKIRLLDGSIGTIGQVWTSTDTNGAGQWSSSSAANINLSNVSATSIPASLIPAANATYDLGNVTGAIGWRNLFVDKIYMNFTGNEIVDIAAKFLYDGIGAGVKSIAWAERKLYSSTGTSMLDWSTAGTLNAFSNFIINVADPIGAQDVATKHYVDNKILVFTSTATVGGAAVEAVTVTGLLSTDTILSVSQKTKGGANLPLLGWSTQINGGITVIYSADMGSGAVVLVAVKR